MINFQVSEMISSGKYIEPKDIPIGKSSVIESSHRDDQDNEVINSICYIIIKLYNILIKLIL